MSTRSTTSRLLNLFGRCIIPYYRRKLARFELSLQHARLEQGRTLARILRFGAETAFGRDYGFAHIHCRTDFRNQLPIVGFDHFAPYIRRVAAGEKAVLFPEQEKLLTFVETSGTTGCPKILPVGETWYRYYSRDWDVWGAKAYADHPAMMGLPILQLSGAWTLSQTPGGHNVASISAMIERFQSPVIKMLYALPAELKRIPDVEARAYCLVRLAATQNVGLISTVTPSSILRIAETTEQFSTQLIRDLHQGTLDAGFDIPRDVRVRLAARARVKRPDLARACEAALSKNGVLRPKDLWRPQMISCWLGGTVGYTSSRIPEYFGDVPIRDQGLLSSEGRHTVPLGDGIAYGPLAVGSNFYEFIPENEPVGPGSTILEAHELETDKRYRMIMTTIGGFYRYDIGDIVQCVGFVGEAPLIEFIQKDGSCCDLEGEKLSAISVCQAAVRAQAASGLTISCFTVAPRLVDGERPRYAVIVEMQEAGETAKAAEFLRAFDADLCANVHIYGVNRKNRTLESPVLARLPQGGWRRYTAELVARRGNGESQYKHPPLVADRKFLEQLDVVDLWELAADGRIQTRQPVMPSDRLVA